MVAEVVESTDVVQVSPRPLEAGDFWVLLRICRNCREEIDRLINGTRVPLAPLGEGDSSRAGQLELDLNELLLGGFWIFAEHAEEDLRPWLASMAQLEPDDFDRLRIPQLLDLFEAIVGQEDWADFLPRLRSAFETSKGSASNATGSASKRATAGRTRR